jgi:5-methylcytosine-specific restriction protein A
MCGAQASLVDHKTPHRGVQRLFWDRSNWQPLCTPCHSGRKQSIERSGASIEAQTRRMPPDLRPSAIPLVIVCGAPGAGKAAYVARQAGERDLVIDLDAIRAALSGKRLYEAGPEWTAPALDERNRLLRSLATDRSHDRAWFIVGAPTRAERDEWAAALRPERVHLVASSFASCVINLQRDPLRRAREAHFSALAAAWHRAYAADIAAVKALSFKRQEPAPC